MANINLGKVALTAAGEYDSTTTYEKLDIVNYQGSSYFAKKSVPVGTTTGNEEYWQLLCRGDPAEVYLKSEIDNLLQYKADSNSVYTTTETNDLLSVKANSIDVYSKSDTDNLLDEKFEINSTTTIVGDILTFNSPVTNGVKDLTVEINPVQDLHGLPNPYPAGGGKNLWSLQSSYNASGDAYFENNTQIEIPAGTYTFSYASSVSTGQVAINLKDANGNSLASGNCQNTVHSITVTLTEPAKMISCYSNTATTISNVQIESGSTATFYVPYSNVCPISGHTQAVVTRTGKNLFDITQGKTAVGDATWTIDADGYVTQTSNADNRGWSYANAQWNIFLPAGTYVVVGEMKTYGSNSISISGRDTNNNSVAYLSLTSVGTFTSSAFTLSKGTEFGFMAKNNGGVYRFAIYQQANAPTAFEAPNVQTVTVDLNGTKYGGLLNVTTGELVVDKISVNMSQLTWDTRYTGTINKTLSADLSSSYPSSYSDYFFISESYEYKGYVNQVTSLSDPDASGIGFWSYWNAGANERIKIYVVLDKNTSPSGKLVYKLASPISIQLSPEEVSTIIGQNNLWCDSGDSTIILRTGAGKMAYQDSVSYSDLTEKPDPDNYYTKSEVESLINNSGVVAELDASGAIATFETNLAENLSRLSVSIDPVQDLHGYDSPWPAGGGKNKVPKGTNKTEHDITFTVQDDGRVKVTGTASALTFWGVQISLPAGTYILNGCPSGGGNSSYTIDIRNAVGGSGISGINGDSGSGSTFTLSEPLTAYLNIRIASGYAAPSGGVVLSPMIRLSSVSDGTYAPYSNICPISGHTQAVVTRTGKNLLYLTADDMGKNWDGNANVKRCWKSFKLPKGKYTFSGDGSAIPTYINQSVVGKSKYPVPMTQAQWSESGATSFGQLYQNGVYSAKTYEVTDEYPYLCVGFISQSDNISLSDFTNAQIQLEAGQTASAYESFTNNVSVTIALGSTVYGAQLDAVAGTLTVTHKKQRLLSTMAWLGNSGWSTYCYYTKVNDIKLVSGYGSVTELICTHLKKDTPANLALTSGYHIGVGQGDGNSIFINFGQFATADDLKAFLADNEVYIVYPLATPTVITGLTPAQIQALQGLNNVWADTGDVAVSYFNNSTAEAITDVKQMIASTETSMTATRNYTSGSLIIVGSALLKATSNISSGASLVLGTNCVRTTLEEWILSLIA